MLTVLLATRLALAAPPVKHARPRLKVTQGIPIGAVFRLPLGDVRLTLVARMQHYNANPRHASDAYDADVYSPKSVRIHPDGTRAYVNSLEGEVTAVYDTRTFAKLAVIPHRFGAGSASLFLDGPPYDYAFLQGDAGRTPNRFAGKPVEMEFTHGGRYLWVSYYRRDYDRWSLGPSAVAVVDTSTNAIVRVLPSGPIPKYLAVAPAGDRLAMVHWGDNTIGFVNIAGADPAAFRLAGLVPVGDRLNLARIARRPKPINRDAVCGSCLRGAVFTADGRWLLVAKLHGGGIAVVDVSASRFIGTAEGMRDTPRHLLIRGDRLYVGSNVSGYVAWFPVEEVLAAAREHRAARLGGERFVGEGVRTIAISPDGRWLYAAVNLKSRLVVLRAADLALMDEATVDSYPVGLDVTPDGRQVWVTSQGRSLRGGNSVCVYAVDILAAPPLVTAEGASPLEPAPNPGATLPR